MTAVLEPVEQAQGYLEERPPPFKGKLVGADRAFRALLAACAALVLSLLFAILAFLVFHGWWALRSYNFRFFFGTDWSPPDHPGVLALLFGSVAIASIAIAIALPVSVACSLMINEYSPIKMRRWLIGLVDLLATVPSIVYGFWALEALSGYLGGPTVWLSKHAGFIPIFRSTNADVFGHSVFLCGVVVAVMIIPVVTSVSREVMSQAPRDGYEAALALGGTRWGAISDVILPFSRSGIIGGALLGFGRALGETMAILIILSPGALTYKLLGSGNNTVPYQIANNFPTVGPHVQSELILAGLTLFATTLVITTGARMVVKRSGIKG